MSGRGNYSWQPLAAHLDVGLWHEGQVPASARGSSSPRRHRLAQVVETLLERGISRATVSDVEFWVLMVVAGVALVVSRVSNSRKKARLAELGTLLGGGHDERSSAWGSALGAPARLRFVTRGSGRTSESWTEIDVELPAHYPFALHIRHHGWFDQGKIERGEMVDITVGDRAFDDAFLIEAAPADIVRQLLDARVRFQLATLPRFQLATTTTTVSVLRLEILGWIDIGVARSAIETLVAISTGVRQAYAQLEAAVKPLVTGAPFRPELDDRPAREAAAARQAEVDRIERLRSERPSSAMLVGVVIAVGVVILFTLLSGR
jgi:hypothetical protein